MENGAYLRIGDQVLEALKFTLPHHPVESLSLEDVRSGEPERLGAVLRLPGMRRVRHLSYDYGWLSPEMLWEFAASPMLRGLESPVVGSFGIEDEGILSLALSPYLAGLRSLRIRSYDHYRPGIGWLTLSGKFGSRAELDIHIQSDYCGYASKWSRFYE